MKTNILLQILLSWLFCSTAFSQASQPTVQASNVTITSRTDNTLSVSWTRGNGMRCLVVVKPQANPYSYPVDGYGNYYTANSALLSGDNLGNNNYVVYNGTGTSVTVTNTFASYYYTVVVYEYNYDYVPWPTDDTDYDYLLTINSSNTESAYTLCTEPTSNVVINSATSISYTTATLNITGGNGLMAHIQLDGATNGSNYSSPVDGTNYTGNSSWGSGSLMSGDNYCVYEGSGSSVSLTALLPATTYYARGYEFCGQPTGNTYNYMTSGYSFYSFTTLNNPPTLDAIANQTDCENGGLQSVALTGISDGSTQETQTVSLSATSSNQTLIPNGNIFFSYTSPASTGTLYYTPATGQYGSATITVTANDGFSSANTVIRSFTVTVLPFPSAAGSISGTTTVCKNGTNYTYTVPAITNATGYVWNFPANTVIVSGGNTNSVTVNFPATVTNSSYAISVYGTNSNGCGNGAASSLMLNFDQVPTTSSAGPDQTICNGTTQLAGNAPLTGTGLWTVTSGSASFNNDTQNNTNATGIASGQSVTLQWTITNGVCPASSDQVTVTFNPSAPQCQIFADFFASNTTPCVGQTVNFTDNSVGATAWSWNFGPNATPATSSLQNPSVVFNATGLQTITLNVTGPNGSDSETKSNYIDVNTLPTAASAISGNSTVCAGDQAVNYSINPIANADSYTWSFPSGANVNSGSGTEAITVDYDVNAVSGPITVAGVNVCGTGPSSTLNITVNPLPADAISVSGSNTVCQGETAVMYVCSAIANATNYTWSLPVGATISSNLGDTIIVDYSTSAISGNVSVYGSNTCGDGQPFILAVTVNPLPDDAGPVSGSTALTRCPLSNGIMYTVPVINNAASYTWVIQTGGSIVGGNGNDTIIIDFPFNATSGNIGVYGSNACGDGGNSVLSVVFDAPRSQEICLVTVDENSDHNIVVWEKTFDPIIDSFRVYRNIPSLGFVQIGSVGFDSLSQYEDSATGIDPNITQYQYEVSILDTCGNEHPLSSFHQTIFVQAPQVNGNDIQLDWDDYLGLPAGAFYYRIMRDTAGTSNWQAIDSVINSVTIYNDINALNEGSLLSYRIEIVMPDICEATRAQNHNSTRSNRTQQVPGNVSTGVVQDWMADAINVYPNPADEYVTISSKNPLLSYYTVELMDINGKLVSLVSSAGTRATIQLAGLERGVYILRISSENGSIMKRVVKQ